MNSPNQYSMAATFVLALLLLMVPRRFALFPLFTAALFLTLKPYIPLLGVNFTPIRILVVFGFLRVLIRGERTGFTLETIDRVVLLWMLSAVLSYGILWRSTPAFVNRLGYSLDTVGVYLLCRIYIRNVDDIARTVAFFGTLMIPLACCMLYEYKTGYNVFSCFGGVNAFSEIRTGRVRSQGSFMHPILVGTFGATMIPLFIALWWRRSVPRLFTVLAVAAACCISITAGSSGASLSAIGGLLAMLAWIARRSMRTVRWGIILLLAIAQLIMTSPIWWIFAKLGILMGGTGWHRSYLIDQAIRHFNEWWMLGARETAHWMPTHLLIDPTKADITNQYLQQGVNGGMLTMVIFITILVLCYKAVGRTIPLIADFPSSIIVWALGASLFAHTLAFFSVAYFDQTIGLWYMLVGMIAAASYSAAGEVELQRERMRRRGGKELIPAM